MNLTKAGEKYFKCDLTELKTLIEDKDTINFNEWLGASLNPILSSELIRTMFKRLKEQNEAELKNKTMSSSVQMRNTGSRGKIRRNLSMHKNLDSEAMKSLVLKSKIKEPTVFQNENITNEHLQLYFDYKVLLSDGSYSFISFSQLMQAKNLNQDLVLKWYHTLLKFANWGYTDSEWYAVIASLLGWNDCPVEILNDVAGAPNDGKDSWSSQSERYRKYALDHKNATDATRLSAYEVTGDIELLPKQAKDIFLF